MQCLEILTVKFFYALTLQFSSSVNFKNKKILWLHQNDFWNKNSLKQHIEAKSNVNREEYLLKDEETFLKNVQFCKFYFNDKPARLFEHVHATQTLILFLYKQLTWSLSKPARH